MRTRLDNPAPVEYQNAVGGLYSRQAMGYHQHGAIAHQAIDRFLNQSLRLGVQRGGSLIKYQDLRILEEGPGNRQPLPLTPGKLDTTVPYLSIRFPT